VVQGRNPCHALLDQHSRRRANHDGATFSLGALFYYFRLEDQVPETHLLRLIEKHISFAFVREKLKESYSETGRPSIDPGLLLRILLIGYLYGITGERNEWMNSFPESTTACHCQEFCRRSDTMPGISVVQPLIW
jgi:hypothetical protein